MNWFMTLGADSQFERWRLQLTIKSLDAPSQNAMKGIMKTFQGQDPKTRAQIGYATIIKKILTSDSNKSWIYLLKNLLIFDKIVNQKLFLEEIASEQLPNIQQYIQQDKTYIEVGIGKLIPMFWKLIKQKAKVMYSKKNILYYSRGNRDDFLSTLSPEMALKQMQTIDQLFNNVFEIISILTPKGDPNSRIYKAKQQIQKSKLISYLNLQLLYFLITLYSCQLLCVNRLIGLIGNSQEEKKLGVISTDDLKQFKQMINKFKNISNQIIMFVEKHKNIKGFQVINYKELDPFKGQDPCIHIDAYIAQKKIPKLTTQQADLVLPEKNHVNIVVERRLNQLNCKKTFNPRKNVELQPKVDKFSIFFNWINSYNDQFPQKQVLTVDLMILLKKQSQENIQCDTQIYCPRQSVIYNYKDTPLLASFQYKRPQYILHRNRSEFKNIYSQLPLQWIQN